MRKAVIGAALVLPLLSGTAIADPHKNEAGHNSRERAAAHAEAEREHWKRQQERAREARKRWEEAARERRKREAEWLREEHERALEWEREHGHGYDGYSPYESYDRAPAYRPHPREGAIITPDGISVWLTL